MTPFFEGVKLVDIASLVIDHTFQARERMDDETVASYAERMGCGDVFPPIHLFDVPGRGLVLADGFHRVEAARASGISSLSAIVVPATDVEAFSFTLSVNRTHGLQRSRADTRATIARALKHPEFVKRSDSWIAKDVGCSDKTVTAAREHLEATSEIPKLTMLLGEDGHMRPRKQAVSLFMVQPAYTVEAWEALDAKQRKVVLATKAEGKFNEQSVPDEEAEESANIEWAKWSWNPITGCRHDCPYCYARDIAERFNGTSAFPNGFAPTLIPKRLAIPRTSHPPGQADADITYRNVFTCSMSDLFGRWVPDGWIDAVLQTVADSPQWNFLFLTKFPKRMADFEFPNNAWVGTSVDCQVRVRNAERAFEKVKASVKWLSCEPMIEPLHFERLDLFQWIVLGGASRSSKTPEWRPPRNWVENIERQAAAAGVMIYEKTNLLRRHRQFPGHRNELADTAPAAFHYLGKASTPDQKAE